MSHRPYVRAAVAAVALGALGACAGPTTSLSYDEIHRISVETAPAMLEVPADRALSQEDAARVAAFGRAYLREAEGELTLAFPADIPSRPVVEEIKRTLSFAGVGEGSIVEGAYDRAVDGDRGVVASYFAPAAEATACPGAVGDPTRDIFNRTPSWFGCATNANLAAMVDRPRDLVVPRPLTPASAERRVQVIRDYQSGAATAAEESAEATATTE